MTWSLEMTWRCLALNYFITTAIESSILTSLSFKNDTTDHRMACCLALSPKLFSKFVTNGDGDAFACMHFSLYPIFLRRPTSVPNSRFFVLFCCSQGKCAACTARSNVLEAPRSAFRFSTCVTDRRIVPTDTTKIPACALQVTLFLSFLFLFYQFHSNQLG